MCLKRRRYFSCSDSDFDSRMLFASRLLLEHKAPSTSGWIRRKYFQSLSGIELLISESHMGGFPRRSQYGVGRRTAPR